MAFTLSAIKYASRLLLTRESFNFLLFPTRHSCCSYSTLSKGPYIYEDISVKLISNYGDGEGSVEIKPFFKVSIILHVLVSQMVKMLMECPRATRLKGLAHPFKPHNLFVQRVVDLAYLEILYIYIYIYIYIHVRRHQGCP